MVKKKSPQYLTELFEIIHRQQCTRYEWKKSKEYIDAVIDFNPHSPDTVVETRTSHIFNEKGERTNVPSYKDYDITWRKAKIANPFEYDWLEFRKRHKEYATCVSETLTEQLLLWGTDEETKNSWVYGWIKEFEEQVWRLCLKINDDL
jgi:hypothetical protein